jgi:hypothetical protein
LESFFINETLISGDPGQKEEQLFIQQEKQNALAKLDKNKKERMLFPCTFTSS